MSAYFVPASELPAGSRFGLTFHTGLARLLPIGFHGLSGGLLLASVFDTTERASFSTASFSTRASRSLPSWAEKLGRSTVRSTHGILVGAASALKCTALEQFSSDAVENEFLPDPLDGSV